MNEQPHAAQPIISGMWKFSHNIPVYRLVAVARGWSLGENGDRYTDIHIRKCSANQYGIGFKYALDPEKSTERQHGKFFHRMKDQLERMFGSDFIGWDVSSPTWVIK